MSKDSDKFIKSSDFEYILDCVAKAGGDREAVKQQMILSFQSGRIYFDGEGRIKVNDRIP